MSDEKIPLRTFEEIQAELQRQIYDAIQSKSTKPLAYNDEGFAMLNEAAMKVWDDMPKDYREKIINESWQFVFDFGEQIAEILLVDIRVDPETPSDD